MIARLKAWLASLVADLKRLLTRSRTFVMSLLGAVVLQWSAIADTITSYQPVADVLGHGDTARKVIATVLFLGAALCRWQDHRNGANRA